MKAGAMKPAATKADTWLMIALLALAALHAAWFAREGSTVGLVVFALPPLLLAALLRWRAGAARFWSGVLALAWFSHGVMLAWSEPAQRGFALAEAALALVVIFAANGDALGARRRRKDRTER